MKWALLYFLLLLIASTTKTNAEIGFATEVMSSLALEIFDHSPEVTEDSLEKIQAIAELGVFKNTNSMYSISGFIVKDINSNVLIKIENFGEFQSLSSAPKVIYSSPFEHIVPINSIDKDPHLLVFIKVPNDIGYSVYKIIFSISLLDE